MSGNLDFDLGDRVKRLKGERLERKRALRKRVLEEKNKQKIADKETSAILLKAEQTRKEAEEKAKLKALEEEKKRQEEYERTGGISYRENLSAYPLAHADTNRVVLPPSAIEKLVSEKALESRGNGNPLTFELSIVDPSTGEVLEKTHSGVDDFTADEGKIGLPPKTALCLTKHRGLHWLKENPIVRVEYVVLKRHEKSLMRIQPRGDGFHTNRNEESANLDIKSILEKTLRDHFVISVGDWIPIVHQNEKYELVVREVEPENAIELLNTDLEVDILPSENAEKEMMKREEEAQRIQNFQKLMAEKEKEKGLLLEQKVEPKKGKGVVTFRVRLPSATVISRSFEVTESLRGVLDWVDYNIAKISIEKIKILPSFESGEYFFDLVESWPGHKRIIDSNVEVDKPLKGLGFIKSGHALTAIWKRDLKSLSTEEKQTLETEDHAENGERDDEWNLAAKELEQKLQSEQVAAVEDDFKQSRLSETEEEALENLAFSEEEIIEIFNNLVNSGADPKESAKVSRLYPAQVKELLTMGFGYCIHRAVPLLLKYNGRLLRVTNSLFNEAEETQQVQGNNQETDATSASAEAGSTDKIKKSENSDLSESRKKQRAQEQFQMKFAELLSLGVDPKEAAVQAIEFVKGQ